MIAQSDAGRRRELWTTVCLAAAIVAFAVSPVPAQIYEWTDEENVTHFANSLDEIPADERENAKVVIGVSTRAPATPSPAPERQAQNEEVEEDAETDEAELDFTAGWDAGFNAGWAAGRQAALAEQPICPSEPTVVVMESRPPLTLNVPRYDPSGAYYQPSFVNRVAGPFDDGASMGMTYRERVQDLRALERGW